MARAALPGRKARFAAVLLAAALGSAAPARSADPAPGGATTSLFDGATLAGWTVENDCRATAKDGVLLLEAGDGWLRSDLTYSDFRLHVEWRALQKEKYDAGIYVRTEAGGKPFPKNGFQVNLLEGKEGNIGNLPGATSTGLVKPQGEWNAFDIECVGERVTVDINGRRAYSVEGLKRASGFLGIQIEVPKGGQFELRNLRVTEHGYASLFDGKSLAGWEPVGAKETPCWIVDKGELVCTGKPGGWLRTAGEHGDFDLRFEYLVSSGGNSGVYVRVPADGNHHRATDQDKPAGFEVQLLDDAHAKHAKLKDWQYTGSVYDIAGAVKRVGRPAGQWNTLEISCRGQHVVTVHNGVTIVDCDATRHPLLALRQTKGFLGLQNHSTEVRFRNLRLGPARSDLPAPPVP
jgi:hypothetical protein